MPILIAIIIVILVYFGMNGKLSVDTLRPEPIENEIAFSENAAMDTELGTPDEVNDSSIVSLGGFSGFFNSFLGDDTPTMTSYPDGYDWKGDYDPWIYMYAKSYGVDPRLVKAVMYQESRFIEDVISYIFDRSTLKPRREFNRIDVREKIMNSVDGGLSFLQTNNIDCSCGLMQLRTITGINYARMITPKALFEAETNIRLGCIHIAAMRKSGVSLPDGIDAYNMGVGNYRSGNRNFDYRNIVLNKMQEYVNDFPA